MQEGRQALHAGPCLLSVFCSVFPESGLGHRMEGQGTRPEEVSLVPPWRKETLTLLELLMWQLILSQSRFRKRAELAWLEGHGSRARLEGHSAAFTMEASDEAALLTAGDTVT